MTNEELAVLAKAGDQKAVEQLWMQVRDFVKMMAVKRVTLAGSHRLELDDLVQSGFVAMMGAVEYFDPERGFKFLTIFDFFLKTEFARAAGYRSAKQKRDPIHRAPSLNKPLTDDPDADELIDLVAAPGDDIADVDDRIWTEQLHEALEAALGDLPEEESSTIRRLFYEEKSPTEIARDDGVSKYDVQKRQKKGLSTIKKRQRQYHLDDFHEEIRRYVDLRTPWFLNVGVDAFTRTNTSAVETLVIKRDGMLRNYVRDAERREAAQEEAEHVRVVNYHQTINRSTETVATASEQKG